MDTANLQLEGHIMAIAAISDTPVTKGVVTHQEIAAALDQAERAVDQRRPRAL
ncbi:UNVERIFIED_ORG: 6,7-dimethyl-8-ribityllumazine synthase [Rhizobium sophorae]|nr:hypothetical protein RLV_0317 [Rhizobium leguminosarum bv. viciae]MBB4525016.1 6,7-dimethyl-8-ribityllumazine synthase [Rhizobium leguminosarum]MBP2490973.1 6,7-dimethyl-8-ribityllumazine synthase [Rhizobium leguminosarum]MDH6662109.1 6,7-dimethyl-8-ribityllumazine synthase [Rhizobium sophorae]